MTNIIPKARQFVIIVSAVLLFHGCIGDDIVFDTIPESVKIMNPIDSLQIGNTHEFKARFLNNVGIEAQADIIWTSTDETVLSIDDNGIAEGLTEGSSMVIARVELPEKIVRDTAEVYVTAGPVGPGNPQVRSGNLQSTSSYQLEGNFTISETPSGLLLSFESDYKASSSLPGLYVYLTNNPSTSNGAYEIGEVTVFQGAHSYAVDGPYNVNSFDYVLYYCKPFSVKVGDGAIQ